MKQIGDMKLYSMDEVLDDVIGPEGTADREAFDRCVEEDAQAYRVGEAIRQAREAKNLTQEQLGNRLGIQRAQISRMEHGRNVTLSSLARVLKALAIPASLDMQGIGRVALC